MIYLGVVLFVLICLGLIKFYNVLAFEQKLSKKQEEIEISGYVRGCCTWLC